MSSPQLPPVLTPGPIAYQGDMTIDTNVLDPVVSTENFCRFVLPSRGFLDVGSVLTFSVKVPANDVAIFPIKTGAPSAISSCILKIGNKTIAITDRYGVYSTIRRSFKTPEERSQKDQVHIGTMDILCPNNGQEGQYQLRDCEYNTDALPTSMVTGTPLPQFMLTNSSSDCPVWNVKLAEMFPALRNLTLPLFLIDQQCSIEIVWNTQTDSAGDVGKMAVFDTTYAGPKTAVVDTYNVKFLADYIVYDPERMEQTARQVMSDQGWSTPYEDVVSVNTNFTDVPAPNLPTESREPRDLGFSGMRLRAVLGHHHEPARNGYLLGQYSSDAYQYPLQYNLRLNDKLVYPQNLSSESAKAHQLGQVFGTDVCCCNCEYSYDQVVNKDDPQRPFSNHMIPGASTILGISQQESLEGSQNYTGCDFTIDGLPAVRNGVVVGMKPVQMLNLVTNTAHDHGGREVTYFGIVERFMTIRQGLVSVSA